MSNTVDVRFTSTTFNKLDDIPYVEGQIISISDRPGYYYDMGGTRKQASGSLDVCMFFDKSGIPISIWEYGRDIYPGPVYNVDQIAYAYISSKVTGVDFEAFVGSELKAVYIDNYPENINLENTQSIPGLSINYLNNENSFDVIAQAMSNLGKGISNKADRGTTLSDYGITDTYTSITIDSKLSKKVDKGKSLQDYGIEDAYRKQDVDILPVLSSMYLLPLYDRYNVKDYGAVGSGFVDDTSAIQDTIDAAAELSNQFVYIPHGKYIISSSLVLDGYSDVNIVFDGKLAIEASSDFSGLVIRNCNNVNIVNLAIHSEKGNNVGVEVISSTNVNIHNMCSDSLRSDIVVSGDEDNLSSNIYVSNLCSKNALNPIVTSYVTNFEMYHFDIEPRHNGGSQHTVFYFDEMTSEMDIHDGNIRIFSESYGSVFVTSQLSSGLTISNVHCVGCSRFYLSHGHQTTSYISNCIIHSNNKVNSALFAGSSRYTIYITGCDIYSSEYIVYNQNSNITISSSNLVCKGVSLSPDITFIPTTRTVLYGCTLTISGTAVSGLDGDTLLFQNCIVTCLNGASVCSASYVEYRGKLIFKDCEFNLDSQSSSAIMFDSCSNISAVLVNCNLSSQYTLSNSNEFEPRLISCTYDNNYDKIIGYTYM